MNFKNMHIMTVMLRFTLLYSTVMCSKNKRITCSYERRYNGNRITLCNSILFCNNRYHTANTPILLKIIKLVVMYYNNY